MLMAACGGDHTVIVTDSDQGTVCTFGTARDSALGHNNEFADQLVLKRIRQALFSGARIVSVLAGSSVLMAMSAEGILYAWGFSSFAQGTNLDTRLVPSPVAVSQRPLAGMRVACECGLSALHGLTFCMGCTRTWARCLSQRSTTWAVRTSHSVPSDLLRDIEVLCAVPSRAYAHM